MTTVALQSLLTENGDEGPYAVKVRGDVDEAFALIFGELVRYIPRSDPCSKVISIIYLEKIRRR